MKHAYVLIAALAATCAVAAAQTLPATTTVLIFSTGTMSIEDTLQGSCWTSSIASPRPNAYRCMAGNAIYDPCFSSSANRVSCPTDIFENRGIVMSLDKPLPAAGAAAATRPWALLLQSGAHCTAGTGTIVPGYPFYCSGGGAEEAVCSMPDLSNPAPAYFVTCAAVVNGNPSQPSSTLVKIAYL